MLPVVLTGLLLAVPVQAAHILNVASTVDAADTNPGDGSCLAPIGGGNLGCTLRAAVQEANALMTATTPHTNITIALPSGTFTLTGAANEDNAASGDLDILGACPSVSITTPCLTITGNNNADTFIEGNNTDRIFHIIGRNTVKITGVTLRNGRAVGADGGAIKNTNGWLTLENCIVTANTADGAITGRSSGGGIYNGDNAQMVINGCRINNNNANNPQADGSNGFFGGGGIFNSGILTLKNSYVELNGGRPFGGGIQNTSGVRLGTGKLTIENSIIQNNSNVAAQGGGVSNYGGAVIMTRTIVRANTANAGGAGVQNTNGANEAGTVSGNVRIISSVIEGNNGGGINNQNSMDISYSTISGNLTSGFGGVAGGAGIRNVAPGELTVQNSTITNNTAAREGGGISNGRSMTLSNVTVSNNSSATIGGGDEIYINTQDTTGDKTELVNTIIGDNVFSANNCAMGGDAPIGQVTAGVITSQGNNLENGNSCGLTGTGDVINVSPNLGVLDQNGNTTPDTELLDNTHPATLMPLSGSAAIGAGTCINKFDQRLYGRPGANNTVCDIGAVETDGDITVGKVDLEVAVTGNVASVSLDNPVTYTLVVTNKGPGAAQDVTLTAQIPLGTSAQVTTDAANAVPVVCNTSANPVRCSTPTLANGASFTVFVTVTPVNASLNGRSIEMRARVDVASPNDYLPGNNGSLTACVSGACVVTAVAPITNFGTNGGGGGAFGLFELLLLAAAPGALVLRRRITRR
jgi:uncharacterized repeat protein (TIGR01451 family)/CSLREA domain-containing protein